MDSALITAAAAGLGSLVGAAASIGTTWMAQRTETIRGYNEWKLREREALYGEFITEASRLTIDALAHSLEKPDQLIALYEILSCIRLMSGEEIVRHGEACCHRIMGLYGRPNLTTDQIRAAAEGHDIDDIDPLKEFSAACRRELLARHG